MKHSLFSIFTKPFYFALVIFVAGMIFAGAGIFPNFYFIKDIISSPTIDSSDSGKIILNLMLNAGTQFISLNTFYVIALAILIGVNISLVVFYIRQRKKFASVKSSTAGFLGFFSGIVGIGCASCGSIFLASFLPVFGLGWIISILPLHGAEFSILSIALLVWSAKIILRGINTPMVCTPKMPKNR